MKTSSTSVDVATPANQASSGEADLVRGLSLSATTALVVGTVIGTGVFIKTAIMAQDTGSASTVLLAWIAAGVLSMCGALTYAELGAMLPHAGGEYVYLRHAYGGCRCPHPHHSGVDGTRGHEDHPGLLPLLPHAA